MTLPAADQGHRPRSLKFPLFRLLPYLGVFSLFLLARLKKDKDKDKAEEDEAEDENQLLS